MRKHGWAVIGILLFIAGPAGAQARRDGTATLLAMLRDPLIWGRDFSSAIRVVPALTATGEPSLQIVRRGIVGGTRHPRRPDAEAAAKAVRGALTNPASPRVPVFGSANPAAIRELDAILFLDDRTERIGAFGDRSAQYLNPDARIDAIEAKYGRAEKVTTEALDDGTERRLVVLTLHHYAGGAIVIATASYDDPQRVDRVYLDTRAVARAAF